MNNALNEQYDIDDQRSGDKDRIVRPQDTEKMKHSKSKPALKTESKQELSIELMVVIGYIRENIKHLIELFNGIIPKDIKILVGKYYNFMPVFHQQGDDMKVINEFDKSTVTMTKQNANWNSTYGFVKIKSTDNCIYEWELIINKLKDGLLLIGIVDIEGDHRSNLITLHDKHYVFHCCGILEQHESESKRLFGSECDKDSKIKLQLNLLHDNDNAYIQLWKDEQDLGIIFQNVDRGNNIEYKFGVSFYEAGDSISIIGFDKIIPKSRRK